MDSGNIMMKSRVFAAVMLCFGLAFSGCASRTDETTVTTSVTNETASAATTVITSTESENAKEYPKDCILDPSVFSGLDKTITLDFKDKTVIQSGEVNGRKYSLTVDLSSWEGNTTPEQIGELSRLFWQVYPAMYERFGKLSEAPADVVLLIEYDGYIERFADYCRFIYCFDDGRYNDHGWTLQTVEDESSRETSVRFLVWLDYNLSGSGRDFMRDYFLICTKGEYSSSKWDSAWKKLFEKTAFEGKDINEVWKEYQSSDFATLSSYASTGETSELLAKYDARKKAKTLNG